MPSCKLCQIKSLAPLLKQLPLSIRGVIVNPSLFPGEECWLAAKGDGVWFGPRSRSRASLSNKAVLGSYEGGVSALCPAALVFPRLPCISQHWLGIYTCSCEDIHAMSPALESPPGQTPSYACHLPSSFLFANSDLL